MKVFLQKMCTAFILSVSIQKNIINKHFEDENLQCESDFMPGSVFSSPFFINELWRWA